MRRILSLLVGLGIGVVGGFCQVQDRSSVLDRALDQRALQSLLSRESGADQVRGVPMEGAIDPHRYVLGPSDVLFVGLWGPVTASHTVTVTPEGTLIIPNVGEAQVLHAKLADAKKEITSMVKRRYPSSEVTVTLLRPRSFLVSLRGSVSKPGQYTATGADRVEKILIEGAEAVYPNTTYTIPAIKSPDGTPYSRESLRPPAILRPERFASATSTRNIRLIRKNGDTLRVDLMKFPTTGDDRFNPFLLDGDIILVPNRNLGRNSVAISGAVNSIGEYEYVEGDRLTDVIALAGGLLSTADPANVILSRPGPGGQILEETAYDMREIVAGSTADPLLRRGDRVLVKESSSVFNRFEVMVTGEVQFPGVYPISAGETRLTKVVQSAGGVTDRALLSGSVILRKAGKIKSDDEDYLPLELELLRSLRTHQLTMADSTLFLLGLRVGRHPVVVDFRKLIAEGDSSRDVILQKDDIIYLASNRHAVLVDGQVAQAGYLPYIPGADYLHYVLMAGGFSEFAETDEVRVIKNGTKEWIEPEKTTIESGDQIWIPKQPRREFVYYMTLVRDVASILGAVGTLIILAIQVSK
ncbi:MAG: SLBB domain-containing protein [Ignavibacteriales bacterium]|nr:SLBB domain-containing protein [Ignavibacteriales bacterium]